MIGQAIVNRIRKAHANGEKFKIYIVIPLMPEANSDIKGATPNDDETNILKTIMHFQFASICKDKPYSQQCRTIFTKLKVDHGIEPSDYIHFGSLQAWQRATKKEVETNLIYVHSKLMIVDDKYAIIGSANINDRSLEGDRDSEMCILYEDDRAGENSFAGSLRLKLWNKYLGDDLSGKDPWNDHTFKQWKRTAHENSERFESIFRTAPNNRIRSWDDMMEYRDKPKMKDIDPREALIGCNKIKGVLIDYPLDFLIEEWYPPESFGSFLDHLKWAAKLNIFT